MVLQSGLWAGLVSRDIDMVVSDHSPCTADLKLQESGDFMKAWGGIASVQFGKCVQCEHGVMLYQKAGPVY